MCLGKREMGRHTPTFYGCCRGEYIDTIHWFWGIPHTSSSKTWPTLAGSTIKFWWSLMVGQCIPPVMWMHSGHQSQNYGFSVRESRWFNLFNSQGLSLFFCVYIYIQYIYRYIDTNHYKTIVTIVWITMYYLHVNQISTLYELCIYIYSPI